MMPNDVLTRISRRRGFNLLEMFHPRARHVFQEEEFEWIRDWGFDFVRVPMSCQVWTNPEDPTSVNEQILQEVDRCVELGKKHGIHVCLNCHRVPGYGSNDKPPFTGNLWKDQRSQDLFCLHWEILSERYVGISPDDLSFNLVNEPPPVSDDRMTRGDHERVGRAAVATIRRVDAGRPIIADGVFFGTVPCPELADLGIMQSCRAYVPLGISHYRATWVNIDEFPEPKWPGAFHDGKGLWDRSTLEQHYAPWEQLIRQGVPVHCGEGGAINFTPHAIVLAWYRDVLSILKRLGIGHALWNLRGQFGVLDSKRTDVAYEDWHGHLLDRKLLELMREF
jgi:endoglucanase